jgi:DNA topoisomerase-1
MGKPLLIVESPAKAKTITQYLNNEYIVRASVGHVRDLPKSNKNAIDIEGGFKPKYEISPSKRPVIRELKELAENADEVVLATDPDREGEAIAWHVAQVLGLTGDTVKRITFNEITKDAVREAIQHPRRIDENLLAAQEARRVLDRLVGYDLSGLIWKKVRYGLSAGRVQSPALRIIMEKERDIRAFQPEAYWVVTADLKKDRQEFVMACTQEPRDKALVDAIEKAAQEGEWKVTTIDEHEQKRNAKPPFKTSTLQQAASTRLGFSPSRTMGAAQKLYEGGHITYMRTDSMQIAESAQAQIIEEVQKRFGKEYLEAKTFATKDKNAQEAHEAIRPTNFSVESVGATDDQRKLYELIWRRTMASQMTPAKMIKTKVYAHVGAQELPDFAVNGSRTLFDGWLVVDPHARGEDVEVPKLTVGDVLECKNVHVESKQTQPPGRYSEAGLVKELEKRGIGRPSTYASIMKTLVDRGYVTKEGRTLIPTDTGDVVSTFLEKNFASYISDHFTAEMEDELDEIAEGKRGYTETLKALYEPFSQEVASKQDIEKLTNLGEAPKAFICPKCGASMVYKLGRGGKFMSCSTFPDCDGARTAQGDELKEPEALGQDPQTEMNIYLLEGPYGPYVQLGKKDDTNKKPKRASLDPDMDINELTLEQAVHLLALPRTLGQHPQTSKDVISNKGRFGPYVGHDGDFRSIKAPLDPYTITLEQALDLLAQEKAAPRGSKKVKDLGQHPKTKKHIILYENARGKFIKKGRSFMYLPDNTDITKFEMDDARKLLEK